MHSPASNEPAIATNPGVSASLTVLAEVEQMLRDKLTLPVSEHLFTSNLLLACYCPFHADSVQYKGASALGSFAAAKDSGSVT